MYIYNDIIAGTVHNTGTTEATPPSTGLVHQPTTTSQDTDRIRRFRKQHHVSLIVALDSIEKIGRLLHSVYAEEIIDDDTYDTFLTKLAQNPQCPPGILSGQLLSIIYKHLERNSHHISTFFECDHIKDVVKPGINTFIRNTWIWIDIYI